MERVLLREPTIVGFSKILDILLILYNNNNNNHIKIYENTIMKKVYCAIYEYLSKEKKHSRWEAPSRQVHFRLYITFRETQISFRSRPNDVFVLSRVFEIYIMCVSRMSELYRVRRHATLADTFYSDFNCTWWWKSAEGQYRCLSCKSDVNGKKRRVRSCVICYSYCWFATCLRRLITCRALIRDSEEEKKMFSD